MFKAVYKLINTISIKSKLLVLIFITLSLVIYFGSAFSLHAYRSSSDMSRLYVLMDLASDMSSLVHESQKERGMTAGYLGSKGAKFSEKLPLQRQVFDNKRGQFLDKIKGIDVAILGPVLDAKIAETISQIEKTQAIRKQVTSLSTTLPKALSHYTKLNTLLLSNIEYLSHISDDANVSGQVVAYASFLQSKERAGIERAVLTNTFALDKFAPGFYKKFVSLVSAQDSYMHSFKVNALPEDIKFYEDAMKDPAVIKVLEMRDVAHEKVVTGDFGIEPSVWFATISKKINQLKAVENHLTTKLVSTTKRIQNEEYFDFILSLILLGVGLFTILLLSILVFKRIQDSVFALRSTMKQTDKSGDLSLQVNIDGGDEFSDIAHSYNRLASNFKSMIDVSNDVLERIAAGDFSGRVTQTAEGDLHKLKHGVNGSADSVEFMTNQLSKVMDGLAVGKFNVRMDKKVPASFRNRVDSALEVILSAITEISGVMECMKEGNFSCRVEADVPGDLNEMKVEINTALDNLEKGINEIEGVMSAQANGDLKQRIEGQYNGTLDTLKSAINASVAQTHSAISLVQESSKTVTGSSVQISQGSAGLTSRVQQQAAELEETATAMENITATVHESTNLAERASDLTQDATRASEEGSKIMSQTIVAMERINEVSVSINDIISLIDNIAFQTNLLALNAAVEAARAGEHGRGFAVVAAEVRSLAGRSADAAKEIKSLIERTTSEVAAGTTLVKSSGEALEGIHQQIDNVSNLVNEIATSSKEQRNGVDQINASITELDKSTQENAALVEETSSASASMAVEAQNLQGVVTKFKI